MKANILIYGLLFCLIACKNREADSFKKTPPIKDTITSSEENIDMHNSRNSLDWQGTYTGTLPCADCGGIETTLILDNDGTYILKQHYLDVDDQQNEFIEKGEFSWSGDGGKITLEGIEGSPTKYFVGENYMLVLRQGGTKVTGELAEHYKLSKQ